MKAEIEHDGANRRAALERLIAAEPQRLRRRSLSLGVHVDDADDVAQTVLLRAWKSVGSLRTLDEGPMCSWLDTIARNAATDLIRSHIRHRTEPVDDDTPSTANTELALELRHRLDAALDAIRGLPDELRAPLVLSVVDGLSAPEIAERLGISAANARQRISRARRALRT